MKKILLASTAVALTAGASFAEVAVSASAAMGLKYTSALTAPATDKTTAFTTLDVSFAGSVDTDAGLTFGAKGTILLGDGATVGNDGTTVYMKGAFGTLTMGTVGEADEMAGGLDDTGLDGLGVDDIAEVRTGDSDKGLGHNVNYSHSVGALSFAVSTAVGKGAADQNDGYALGAKYTFGESFVGLGYNKTDIKAAADARDGKAISLYAGSKMGAFGVKAMYTKFSSEIAASDVKAYGINLDYTAGAATISLDYADNDLATNTKASYGLGVSYDLGADASVGGGIAKVNGVTKADLGVAFSF